MIKRLNLHVLLSKKDQMSNIYKKKNKKIKQKREVDASRLFHILIRIDTF